MRQKRYRTRPITVTVNVSMARPDSRELCPYCGEPFERVMPVLGMEGVAFAYAHDDGEDEYDLHFPNSVLRDFAADLETDSLCLYECGGDEN